MLTALAALVFILSSIFILETSNAATNVTVKLVDSDYTAVGGETVLDIEQPAGVIIPALAGAENEVVALRLPASTGDFEPIELGQIAVDTEAGLFLAVRGNLGQLFGESDAAVLVALQWDDAASTTPTISIGAKLPSLSLAALNPNWTVPGDDQPLLGESWIGFATGAQSFPDNLDGITDFYPENFSLSGDNTIDAGFTFNSGLHVRSVIGDDATSEIFRNVNQVVSLRGNINADLNLFGQEDDTADGDEVEVAVVLEASTSIDAPPEPDAWFAATGTWTLRLEVQAGASPSIEVSGSGQLQVLDAVVDPAIELSVDLDVTHESADDRTTVTFESSTVNEFENVFDTDLDINDVTLTLTYIKEGTESTSTATLSGEFEIGSTTMSATIGLEAEGTALAKVTFAGDATTAIPVSDITSWLGTQIGFDTEDLDAALSQLVITGLHLRLSLDVGGTDRGGLELAVVGSSTYQALAIEALFYARRSTAANQAQQPSGITMALRIGNGENPTLGDLIPSITGDAGSIPIPDVVLGFSTIAHPWNADEAEAGFVETPAEIVEFFRPVYLPGSTGECAADPDCAGRHSRFDIPAGAFLAGSITVPAALNDVLDGMYIDHTKPVLIKGKVSLFGESSGEVSLRASLPPIQMPEDVRGVWFHSGELSLGIDVDPSPLKVSVFISGAITVRMPNVITPDPANDADYDLLKFSVSADISLTATSATLTLTGAMVPPDGLENAWEQPFGIEWLTIRGVAIQFGVQADAVGFGFTVGFAGALEVAGKDLQGALSLELTTIPVFPHVSPNLLGVRFASNAGLEFQDIVTFANTVATASGSPAITLPPEWSTFQAGVKDIEISYAIADNPRLCLFQGVRLRGFLYLGPESQGYAPAEQEKCIPGSSDNTPGSHEGLSGCQDTLNKAHGCFAGIDIEVSEATGLFASVQIGGFTLGPIETQETLFELIVNTTQVSLTLKGGVKIDNVLRGSVDIGVRPDGWHIFGDLGLFEFPPADPLFQATVSAKAGLSLQDPHFVVDGRIASNFGEALKPIIEPLAVRFAAGVAIVNGFVQLVNSGATVQQLLDYIVNIPAQLTAMGLGNDPLVIVLNAFSSAYRSIIDGLAAIGIYPSIDTLIDYALQGVTINTPDVPGKIIFGECVLYVGIGDPNCTFIHGFTLFSIPGLCTGGVLVVPNCNSTGLVQYIAGGLNQVVASVLGIDTQTLLASLNTIATNFAANPIVFDVACAAFNFSVGAGDTVNQNGFGLKLKLIVLGSPVYIGPLSWNFADSFESNLTGVLSSLGASLTGTAAPFACEFDGSDLAGVVTLPPSGLAQSGTPVTVNEGGSTSIRGTFDPGTFDASDTQTVTIYWPGSAPEVITQAPGATSFTSSVRSFADDNPSNTAVDVVPIPVTVKNSRTGSVSATFAVSVKNVAPVISTLSALPATINEGDTVTLTGTISDPGTLDSFNVQVAWGDNTSSTLTLPAGSTSFTASHKYADDPAGDDNTVTITVTLTDDDTGTTTKTTNITVNNVAPTLDPSSFRVVLPDDANANEVDEGQRFNLEGTFSDPGTADSHTLEITWAEGLVTQVTIPPAPIVNGEASATRSFSIPNAFVDDNPTATPSDLAIISVRVVDDDGGESEPASKSVRVNNVDPAVSIEFAENPIVENGTASITVTITDPGLEDTYSLVVDWGDGSADTTVDVPSIVDSAAGGFPEAKPPFRTVTLTHQYLDDNPTGTPSDQYIVTATVTDDDTGTGTGSNSLTVENTVPRVNSVPAPASVQYSDSLAAPVTVVFDDVSADTMTASTTWSLDGAPSQPGLPADFVLSDGPCIPVQVAGLPDPRTACAFNITGRANVQPGTYVITVTATDDDTAATSADVTIVVLPEDARVDYTGPTYVSAPSVLSGGFIDVELRATVRDISVVPGIEPPDTEPGDITHATVTFVDRGTGAVLCTAQVTRIFADDTTTGGAACTARFSTTGNAANWTFNVGQVVGGWYIRDDASDNVTLTVLRPFKDYLHSSGFINAGSPAGSLAPTQNSRVTVDAKDIEFSKNLDKLTANSTVTFRSGGVDYIAVVTAVDSFAVVRNAGPNTNIVQVEARVTLYRGTHPNNRVEIGQNLRLQLRFSDVHAPSTPDSISFVIWDPSGLMIAATDWAVVRTIEVITAGGQVLVKP